MARGRGRGERTDPCQFRAQVPSMVQLLFFVYGYLPVPNKRGGQMKRFANTTRERKNRGTKAADQREIATDVCSIIPPPLPRVRNRDMRVQFDSNSFSGVAFFSTTCRDTSRNRVLLLCGKIVDTFGFSLIRPIAHRVRYFRSVIAHDREVPSRQISHSTSQLIDADPVRSLRASTRHQRTPVCPIECSTDSTVPRESSIFARALDSLAQP